MLYLYHICSLLFEQIRRKIVVLMIVTRTKGETVYFDKPIPKVHFIKLLSCSLFNSWHSLKRLGQIAQDYVRASLAQGHYTIESIAKEPTNSYQYYKNNAKLAIKTFNPNSSRKNNKLGNRCKKKIGLSGFSKAAWHWENIM